MTIANYVTLARIILVPISVILLLFGINGLAALVFIILCFSDAIDGYIARRYDQVSEFGKLIDPLADKILVISLLIALVGLGKASSIPVILLVVRELLVSAIRTSVAKEHGILAASQIAKYKTASQMLAVFMLILDIPLAALVLWLSVVIGYISGGAYLWQNQRSLRLK